MSIFPSRHIQEARSEARDAAEQELLGRGFERSEDGQWHGSVTGPSGAGTPVRIVLPVGFPDYLPDLFLDSEDPRPLRPHIERGGRLCIAPQTGILIDVDRPRQIVADALEKAKAILWPEDEERLAQDISEEFNAYWPHLGSCEVACLFSPEGDAREVLAASLEPAPKLEVVAEGRKELQIWTARSGRTILSDKPAYFMPLQKMFPPPAFLGEITLKALRLHLLDCAGAESVRELNTWLNRRGLPARLIFSAPSRNDTVRVVFAADLRPRGMAMLTKGFRVGSVPKDIQLARSSLTPIVRLNLMRLDPTYLVRRGGGDTMLLKKHVVVVGCGAVGSHIAEQLALAGIGSLVLIDKEDLAADNVHRHVLGLDSVGKSKSRRLAELLQRRFPHLEVSGLHQEFEAVLIEKPGLLAESDLVIVSLGDETLERRINRALFGGPPRVHVWLEPLGLGGHVLSIPHGEGRGCFECLYRREAGALTNMASLSEPGQVFVRTLGGCTGTFTPFGGLDAQQAAIEASRESISFLQLGSAQCTLKSWCTSTCRFLAEGFKLSRRGESIGPGMSRRDAEVASSDCIVCGRGSH